MVYVTFLKSWHYPYQLNIAHLYGNLMNTYGDNGNILMLKYVAENWEPMWRVDIVSLHDDFDENHYDIAFFSVGDKTLNKVLLLATFLLKKREHWQLHPKRRSGSSYLWWFPAIGPILCWSFRKRIEGLGVMGHYPQPD